MRTSARSNPFSLPFSFLLFSGKYSKYDRKKEKNSPAHIPSTRHRQLSPGSFRSMLDSRKMVTALRKIISEMRIPVWRMTPRTARKYPRNTGDMAMTGRRGARMRREKAAAGSPSQLWAMEKEKTNRMIAMGMEMPRPYRQPYWMTGLRGYFSSDTSRVTPSEIPAEEKVTVKEKTVITRPANPMPTAPKVRFR